MGSLIDLSLLFLIISIGSSSKKTHQRGKNKSGYCTNASQLDQLSTKQNKITKLLNKNR